MNAGEDEEDEEEREMLYEVLVSSLDVRVEPLQVIPLTLDPIT